MPQSPLQLLVALQSRRALTEWSSLVSMVPISTGRSREVSRASKALIKRSLGSLFSHLGLRSGVEMRGIGEVRLLVHCQLYWGPL